MCRFVKAQLRNIINTSPPSDSSTLSISGEHLHAVGLTALLTVMAILMTLVIYMAVSGPLAPTVPETDNTSFNGRTLV
ncbi:MAG: hypothetical protein GY841_10125 [FCB group bacterium]|nr:hypothetical protein [FCB group bacterium]